MRRFRVKINDQVFEVEVEEMGRPESVAQAPMPVTPPPVTAPATVPVTPVARPAAPAAPAAAPARSVPSQSPSQAGGDDAGLIKAPIPGVISEIRVSPGKAVKRGDVLLLLEAMKMQNEILAPYDAVVSEVLVNQGASVQTGDPLVKLDR